MIEHYEYTSHTPTTNWVGLLFGGAFILLLLWIFERIANVGKALGLILVAAIVLFCIFNWSAVDRFIAGAF